MIGMIEKDKSRVIIKEEIKDGLKKTGIEAGDTVFFHSSLKSLGRVENGPDTVIDAFLEVAGEEGTVVVPTLTRKTYGTPENIKEKVSVWNKDSSLPALALLMDSFKERAAVWDVESTPSDVGLITEVFRKRKNSLRSNHPTHSISAIGAKAEYLTSGHQLADNRPSPWGDRAFGERSPWEKLYEINAKYFFLGVDFNICTMFHYVQARYWKENLVKLASNPPFPHFDMVLMGKKLEEKGLLRKGKIGEAVSFWLLTKELVDNSLILLRENPLIFFKKDGEFYAWYKKAAGTM